MTGEEAKAHIEQSFEGNVSVIEYGMITTCDFREDQVRIHLG
jgi:uncharacterized protein YuzB (UPF0349 family)